MTEASAPGKAILLGEHAVVYGRPAIAVPVAQVRATATVEDAPPGTGITILAQDLGKSHVIGQPADAQLRPLEVTVRNTLAHLNLSPLPDLRVAVRSTIPIGRGLGSGTAVSTALVRALARHFAVSLSLEELCALVYATEIIYHGTPSGIDNTVIAYERPVYFVRGERPETFAVGRPFPLVIADTGIFSPTWVAVGQVRDAWERDRVTYEGLFDAIGQIVQQGKRAILEGDLPSLGALMNRNHELLQQLRVSSPELDRLVEAARAAGALGAKLSGAGRGGHMIALASPGEETAVADALRGVGATHVFVTVVSTEEAPCSSA